MYLKLLHRFSVILVLILTGFSISHSFVDNSYRLWLNYQKIKDQKLLNDYNQKIFTFCIPGKSETCRLISNEVRAGLRHLLGKKVLPIESSKNASLLITTPSSTPYINKFIDTNTLSDLGQEGYLIYSVNDNSKNSILIIANSDIGLLYGAFHFLRLLQTCQSIDSLNIVEKPKIRYRILNHWDNLDGSIERGYAGKSLWKWKELPDRIDPRYYDYARANASIGINGVVLNNVNADPDVLRHEFLKKIAKLADIFRPFGIKVFLSINFSSPISPQFAQNRKGGIGNLETADPLNSRVRKWWKDKVKEIFKLIPDFGGFLVKANSEGMPGPQDYGRTHADGANMLAEALQPYGGIVMWRAFVYNPEVDPDRAKRAYLEFVPLDGKFLPNVLIQAKNGPIDFQPREPVQPLFGAMPKTPLMLELQITQEYLGHSTHLVFLAPMWKEYLEFDTYARGKGSTLASIIDGTLYGYKITGIAGVSNVGDDTNWCGHFFAQANWYAFGRLAWDHTLTTNQIAEEWIRMSLSNAQQVIETVKEMMLGSWEACVNYMTPLGLHHIMQEGFHYGPAPGHYTGREDWTSVYYHRADTIGIGFNRSSSGSNFVSQYFFPVREIFNNIETCPEKYLLWFHHVPWDYKLHSGKTLWQELCIKYYEGTNFVDKMIEHWSSIEQYVSPEIFQHVKSKLNKQKIDAEIWRDTCLNYFQKFSKKPIFKTDLGKK